MLDVLAVVVTFNPELSVLHKMLLEFKRQNVKVLIVDNGSSIPFVHDLSINIADDFVNHTLLADNLGIAFAHNIGIEYAKKSGFKYVLLMDQDSVPYERMVHALFEQAEKLEKFGSIGPRYIDERQNNPPPFMQIIGLKLVRHACSTDVDVVPVDYLISSGSLISLATLDVVGGMREDLFIDYVDIEWGLRAKTMGYQSYGVCGAKMSHSLGENPVRFFKKVIPLHSPLRHYYHFRNAVLLYKSQWLPLNWKIVDGTRLILRYGFYTLFAIPRLQHWWMMTLGLVHGLINRSGKY
jgi:rhamnosyltransferase